MTICLKSYRLSVVFYFLAIITSLYLFTTFGFSIIRISGNSMSPNLQHSDWVVISKYEPWLKVLGINYKRGDIVYFYQPSPKKRVRFIPIDFSNDLLLTKRVVALAGENIKIKKGQVFINGELLKELYLESLGSFSMTEKYVPENQIFVMGDNRKSLGSIDSRHFGTINQSSILGRVWPLSYW